MLPSGLCMLLMESMFWGLDHRYQRVSWFWRALSFGGIGKDMGSWHSDENMFYGHARTQSKSNNCSSIVHVHRRPEVLFFCASGATSGDLARLTSLKSILPLSTVSRTTVQKEQLSSFPFGLAAGE
jgi:hypothetical protein